MKYYYRFGELPDDEQSTIFHRNEPVGKEAGISVYNAVKIDDEWVPVIPPAHLRTETTLDDYIYHLNYFRGKRYIVSGTEVGKGSNGEPLLKNIKIEIEL